MSELNVRLDGASSALNPTVASAQGAIDAAVDKTVDVLRPAVNHFVADVHGAVGKLATAASQASDKLQNSSDNLRDAGTDLTNSFRAYVQEKPLTALGIAVASGFFLSWVMRLRNSSN